nr:formate dehydrogenase subunit alpha [Desulfobacterales bacterium]
MKHQLLITIDDRIVSVRPGTTILEAAHLAGIRIPTLCHHPAVRPSGSCRLCAVEVGDYRGLPAACTTPVEDGMRVWTVTPKVKSFRKEMLRLILEDLPPDYFETAVVGSYELHEVAKMIGLDGALPSGGRSRRSYQPGGPFFHRDYELCVRCGRCVRICHEVRGAKAIVFRELEGKQEVGTPFNRPLEDAGCEFCGACVDACPTGALRDTKDRRPSNGNAVLVNLSGPSPRTPPLKLALESGSEIKFTICPYCGVGCRLACEVRDGKMISTRPDPLGPANEGQACVKGRFGVVQFVHDNSRLIQPLIRNGTSLEPTSWDHALETVANAFKRYRPDEIAVLTSAKCTNEENYVIQKFVRAVLKTNSVDHCARLCHSPTVAGLVTAFGSGAMTNTIEDIGEASALLVIGSNTSATHPVIGTRVRRAVLNGARLIVANPCAIPLTRFADVHLQHRPGTDLALLMGMARLIVDDDLVDKDFVAKRCENFEAFRESLEPYDLEFVSETTGVPGNLLVRAAHLYAGHKPATILYGMGITQHSHGTDNVLAVANLAMLTGNIGKPGSGVNPLRGQNNVQGACDMGGLPNVYPGYQPVTEEEVRKKFEQAWGTGLPAEEGLTSIEMFEAVRAGKIRAMYIIGENPALSEPDLNRAREALERLEFLVVQDIFPSETTAYAHVVLPAATSLEKSGSFTNTERRVQWFDRVVAPPGNARPDWWIVTKLAKKMGASGFDYAGEEEILTEINGLTPSYAGITPERLKTTTLQWPCPTTEHPGTPILHAERFTRGLGRFQPISYKGPVEMPDESYPFYLTTARSLFHYHTGTMTRKVEGLTRLLGEELVVIHPEDGRMLGVGDGDWVRVISRRGEVKVRAKMSEEFPRRVVAMDFHFGEGPVNVLTNPAHDPMSRIPEYKVCAVRVEKV